MFVRAPPVDTCKDVLDCPLMRTKRDCIIPFEASWVYLHVDHSPGTVTIRYGFTNAFAPVFEMQIK
jgi:hypothetical protein